MIKSRKTFWFWVLWAFLAGSLTIAIPGVQAQERQAVAEIIALVGNAEIKSPPETLFRKAKLKDSLYARDQVRTLEKSRAKLFFKDETILMLGEKTSLDISQFQMDNQNRRQNALFKVLTGTMRFIIHKFYQGLPPGVQVEGMTAVMGVRGSDCIIEVRSPDLFLNIGASPEWVKSLTTGESITLPAGIWARVMPGLPITTGTITPAMRQQYINQTQAGQTQLPDQVTAPPALITGGPSALGNPLVPQDSQYRSLTTPSIQGAGVQPALPSIHHGASPTPPHPPPGTTHK
ncbi:MAG: FecR domain-containing protein [Thermodesulfobacteriota bacterium]